MKNHKYHQLHHVQFTRTPHSTQHYKVSDDIYKKYGYCRDSACQHRVDLKVRTLTFYGSSLCQILTNFQNSLTAKNSMKFQTNCMQYISPHLETDGNVTAIVQINDTR